MEEKTREELELENEELRERLREAEEVLRAIRRGEVDALAVSDSQGERIYTLQGADRAYRVLIDTMSEGALTLSPDGSILYGNNRIEEMLGAPLAKVVGSSIYSLIVPEDRESFESLLRRAEDGSVRGEVRLFTGSGVVLPVRLSVSTLELDSASGFCIVASDLSELKRSQEELRIYSIRLETINRELSDFIFIATHDLQEPLRKIQTFCTRAKAGISRDGGRSEALSDLDRVENAAKRMRDLLRALMSYSRVFKDSGPLQPIDLGDVLLNVQTELSKNIEEAGATVTCWSLPTIEADSVQMHRLFKNLLTNSLKFRRDVPPAVKIYGEVSGEEARIFIEDNGMGLDESYVDRIFKPFQQLHGRGDFEGTGIGLAICRKIVERHGGAITVQSTPGEGSTFIVTLPLSQSALSSGMRPPEDTLRERTKEELTLEIYKVKERLKESEELISAIREGKIDALVSYEPGRESVYTLQSADRGYRLLVESIHEGALILSLDGSIYYMNPRFEEMVKGDSKRITSSPMAEYVYEEDRERFESLLCQAGQGRAGGGELRLKIGDGTRLPVALTLSPLDLDGFSGVCITLTDLTEQKLYIEKLERSNRELQEFAFVASHDLQEPLRKVSSFGNLLKQNDGGAIGERGKDYLDRMLGATERMQVLLRSLLEYSRVATKAQPFRRVELGKIIRDVLSDLEVRIQTTGGKVHVGDLPALEADATQMRQLFQNLIGNALKFHKEGERPTVRVQCTRGSEHYEIAVEDNGIGFDEKYLDRIFSPFQRLNGRSEYEGTGMGLAICKKIVERHGGAIMARSSPGEGSTFIVTLPLRQQKEEDV